MDAPIDMAAPIDIAELTAEIDRVVAETGFAGVVRVDIDAEVAVERAYGLADRRHGIATRLDGQFGLASGVKGFTALVVASLVADGVLDLSTTARSVLGTDLPLIADDVTVEHLLGHRSGIGDYLDEDLDTDRDDYLMPVPVHALVDTEQYLAVLDGFPTKFPAGTAFSYCNGGFVVLALIAERAAGTPFHELVAQRVCGPAGMADTAFLRSDELPERAAVGYLATDGLRTNVLHLPVRGNGDGGIYSTIADIHAFWPALFAGQIVPREMVDLMVEPRSDVPDLEKRYGLGFWLHPTGPAVQLEGCDTGVSFRTVYDPTRQLTHTVIGNTMDNAWPISRLIRDRLTP